MPSSYSSSLKIELMATGENSGTWGTNTNTNLGTAMEQAVIGYGNIDYVSDANLTISITNSNASQAARCLVLNVTSAFGSLSATRELIVPTSQKQYIVQNNTTGGQSITVKTSAGTGITVPNGRKAHLYVDGTNVIQMFDFVDINGGAIDGTPIGAASASTGAFSTLSATGNVTLGDADTDTITQAASYVTGTQLKSAKTATNTLSLAAYDVDGTTYTNLITLTAGNTPTLALTSTGVGTINNMSIGATTASTGAFSTLSASSTVTLSGGTINGVAFLNGSNVLTTGSALVFDGTTLKNDGASAADIAVRSASGNAAFMRVAGNANTLGTTSFDLVQGSDSSGFLFNRANAPIVFGTNNTEGMRLTSTSLYTASTIDVGIGTSSPGYKLDVLGNVNRFAGAGVDGIFLSTVAATDFSFYGANYFNNNGTEGVNASGRASWRIATLTAGSPTFSIGYRAPSAGAGTFSTPLTIDSSGNLGIGVTSPLNRLDVRAASAVIGNYQTIQASSTNSAAVDLGGGIGLGGYYSGTSLYAIFGNIVGRKENATDGNYAGYLAFGTNAQATGVVERARIDSSGNLLVGDTSQGTIGSNSSFGAYSSGYIGVSSTGDSVFSRRSTNGDVVTFRRDTSSVGAIAVTTTGVTLTGTNGITFTAAQTASANANTLDDYEEGTWTPTLTGDGGGTAMTYTSQIGKYTKIGNVVIADAYILLSAKGTITGNVVITGLPFTGSANYNSAINWGYWANLGANWMSVGGWLNNGDTIYLGGRKTAGAGIDTLLSADIANNSRINVQLTYTI